MTCQEVIGFLSDYLDGTLPWRQNALFVVHLGLCRDCRNYLASFRQTKRLLEADTQEMLVSQLPPIPEDLVQAILEIRK